MKKTLFVSLYLFFSIAVLSQSTETISGSEFSIAKITTSSGDIYAGTDYSIGYRYDSGADETIIARAIFGINLPSSINNAQAINSASLSVNGILVPGELLDGDEKLKVNFIGTSDDLALLLDAQTYNNVSSGTLIGEGSSYNGQSDFDVKNVLTNNKSKDIIYFGVYCSAGKLTALRINMQLYVNYKPQKEFVDFFVANIDPGGSVLVDEVSVVSGTKIESRETGTNVQLQAIDNQFYNGYNHIWNSGIAPEAPSKWEKIKNHTAQNLTSNISYNLTVTNESSNATYQAGLRKVCNVSLSSPQSMSVSYNGQNYSGTSVNFTAVEYNDVTIETPEYYIDNQVKFTFKKWSDNNTSRSRTINLTKHETLQAEYEGVAISNYMAMNCPSGVDEKILLQWNEHPHPSVTQYKIYRKTKTDLPVCIATLNRGTTSFTDNAATKRETGNELLSYSIDCYYAPDNTWSEHYWAQFEFAVLDEREMKDWGEELKPELTEKEEDPEVKENTIKNYPNPFNPSTKIEYSLKEASNVKIVVYDMLGQEIKTLVNSEKPKGKYSVTFDASNLPSGMYYCKMASKNFNKTIKLLLTK